MIGQSNFGLGFGFTTFKRNCQSQHTQATQLTNQSSTQVQINSVAGGKTRATASRLVSHSVNQNHSQHEITFSARLKTPQRGKHMREG